MNNRMLSLTALFACLLPGLVLADNSPASTTRQASVVIPMLSHFSPKDTSAESVMSELEKMLGKFDNDGLGGQAGSYWTFYSYRLDDNTQIIVEFMSKSGHGNPDLVLIFAQLPDGKLVQLGGVALMTSTRPIHKQISG